MTPGDGIHKKLTQLADDIKNQDEETQDYTINQIKRLKKLNLMQFLNLNICTK